MSLGIPGIEVVCYPREAGGRFMTVVSIKQRFRRQNSPSRERSINGIRVDRHFRYVLLEVLGTHGISQRVNDQPTYFLMMFQ